MITAAHSDSLLLTLLADNSAGVKRQLDVALEQQSTGRVSDTYGGLGAAGARTSLDLRPALQHTQVWQTNIDSVSSRLDVTQSALQQMGQIAASFYAQTSNLNNVGVSEASAVASSAKLALQQMAELLNIKDGNTYVFSGQDTANAAMTSTDPAVIGPQLLASDVTTAPPFSATIGTALPSVEVGEGQHVSVGLLANRNTMATSLAPTTGSYMRDIMRALATLATITDGPGLAATAADTRTRLKSAVTALADETGALGNVQAQLQTRKTTLASTQTALSKQVSNVEDVDMATTITKVSALQTQLQASYQVIAGVKGLSLVSYL